MQEKGSFELPHVYGFMLENYIHQEQWDEVERLHDKYPEMARERVSFIIQGYKTRCLPLHRYLAESACAPPLSFIEKVVAAHPQALLECDSRRGQLPLHMALSTGSCPEDILHHVIEAMPSALAKRDGDGNLPLHYAGMVDPASSVLLSILELYPDACEELNGYGQYPLHMLCARCWDNDHDDDMVLLLDVLHSVIMYNPEALAHRDGFGRLPLHLACSNTTPRYAVLKVLINEYPSGLLERDVEDNSPLTIVEKFAMKEQQPQRGGTGRCKEYRDAVVEFVKARTRKEQVKEERIRKKIVSSITHTLFPWTSRRQ